MTTNIVPITKNCYNLIGMDIVDVMDVTGNFGRAYIGFGESLDAENPALTAVKKSVGSLFSSTNSSDNFFFLHNPFDTARKIIFDKGKSPPRAEYSRKIL